MTSALFYRIASVLLLLFTVGHTLGFRTVDPSWGVTSTLDSLRSIHFNAQGFNRTYWDFYVGFGLFVSVFLLFAAVTTWQLAGLSTPTLAALPLITWGLTFCFVVVSILSWKYFFVIPVIFSLLITVCLLAAAVLSRK